MKNLKRRFQEDPEFALMTVAIGIPIATGLITAVAKLVGSSGYAVHAAKRK